MAVAGSLTYDTKIDRSGIQSGLNGIKNDVQGAGSQIRNIISALGITKLISSAFSMINNSIDGAVSRFDTLNNFPRVMSNLGIGADESTKSINKLSDKLQGLPTTLNDAALGVQRIASSNGDLEKSTDIFLALNNAIIAGGASTEIQSSALEQMCQAFAKGKPDLMEWRSIMTAMPAQLKQVSTAMGYANPIDLYEAIKDGNVQFNDFIDTIVRMNKEGLPGYLNFEEQARNATDGIQTSMTNFKTAVARGVASAIQSIDDGLKKNKMPNIATLISKCGKQIEGVIKKLASYIPDVITKIFKAGKELYKIAPKLITIIATLVTTMGTFKKAIEIKDKITSLTSSMSKLSAVMAANPWAVAIAGVVGVAAALGTAYASGKIFNETLSKEDEELKKVTESIAKERDMQLKMNEASQNKIASGMKELSYYESLYARLQQIVDENGRVKEGYEDRANFIVNELSKGMGMEISLIDGTIQGYENLKTTFDDLIKKKKAKIVLDTQEKEYETAIKNQQKAIENLGNYYITYQDKLKEYRDTKKEVTSEISKLDEIADVEEIGRLQGKLNRAKLEKDSWKSKYDDQKTVVSNYIEDIKRYESNLQSYQEGHYEKMLDDQGVFLSELKLQTDDDLKNREAEIEREKVILDTLKKLKKQHNTDIFDEQIKSQEQQLEALKKGFDDRKAQITQSNTEETMTWLAGISKTLYDLTGKTYEFESVGDGMIQMYINGVKKKKPIAETEIETFATNLVNKAKKDDDSKKNGENLIDSHTKGTKNAEKQKKGEDEIKKYGDKLLKSARRTSEFEESGKNNIKGINKGIQNQTLQNEGRKLMCEYAKSLQNAFNKENKTHSPSRVYEYWASMIPAGITKGIEENQDSSLLAIKNMANEMYEEMRKSVDMSMGEVRTNATVSSNHAFNNTIVINAEFDGNVDMDGKRVGRIITPHITKTIKSGGIR